MRPHLPRMVGEQRLPRRFVRRLERAQIRVERHLRVDDDVLAARQPDDDVGTHAAIGPFAVERLLLVEVAVLDHAGELDDALQLQLAPAAADAGTLERVDEPARFGLQFLADGVERGDALQEAGAVLHRAVARRPASRCPRARAFAPSARADPRWLSCARRCPRTASARACAVAFPPDAGTLRCSRLSACALSDANASRNRSSALSYVLIRSA